MSMLVVATGLFVGLHFFLSWLPVRNNLVGMMGAKLFQGFYSLVMIVLLVGAIMTYMDTQYIPVWGKPEGSGWVAVLLTLPAFILFACSILTPNPMAVGGEKLMARPDPAPGIFKITRHPMMWGVSLWAVAHLIANGDVASIVFFGGLLVLALLGPLHIDHKRRVQDPGSFDRMEEVTSYLPFQAVAQGRASVSLKEVGWWRIGVGFVFFAAFLAVHQWLFGAAPLA